MKYMVELSVDAQTGNELEAQPGGPGPVVGRLLDRFKPESVYMTMTERKIYMVVDLDDAVSTAELMIAGAKLSGSYPKFTPVISGSDFPEVVGPAIEGANSVVNG